MNQFCLLTLIALSISLAQFAPAKAAGDISAKSAVQQQKEQDLEELKGLLQKYVDQKELKESKKIQSPYVDAEKLSLFLANQTELSVRSGEEPEDICKDAKISLFTDRYGVSSVNGEACAIYDYSFPTVAGYLGYKSIAKIPSYEFDIRDIINWLNGNWSPVEKKFEDKSNRKPAKWIQDLPGQEFKLSSLNVGKKFQFTEKQKATLKQLILGLQSDGASLDSTKVWLEVLDNPITILDRIKLIWNDTEKLYEVVVDASFLPVFGPVELVNLQKPYRFAAQRLARSILSVALINLSSLIPEPIANRIVTTSLSEIFDYLEEVYSYQLNLLEPSLRDAELKALDSRTSEMFKKSIDITYASRTGFFNEYLMSVIQGKKFDWNKIVRVGRNSRYRAEKARDISMNNLNNKLVQENGCQSEFYHDYFAKCFIKGELEGVYSLVSETNILFWSLGPTPVYLSRLPVEMTLRRSISRAFEMGLKVFSLPIGDFLNDTLVGELANMARIGVEDEALLRGALALEKQSIGTLDAGSSEVFDWLFIQHVNPLLPFSEMAEQDLIHKGIKQGGLQ